MNTLEYLKKVIADAPEKPAPSVPDLAGWRVGPEEYFICSRCAGRILDRGSSLPSPAWPIWADDVDRIGACVLCEGATS